MLIKKIVTAVILFVILTTSVVPIGVGAQAKCPDGTDPITDGLGGRFCDDGKGGLMRLDGSPTTIGQIVDGAKNIVSAGFELAFYNVITENITGFWGFILQRISSLFLIISGLLFDKVVQETVINMSSNIGTNSGIGIAIQSAWSSLRDIANMVFIFVLLYTAFNAMFFTGIGNVGRNIVWIIIIALVINFSLFFSKVVIDASNIVSIGFYRALENAGTYTLTKNGENTNTPADSYIYTGISGGYMRMLGIHNFWSSNTKNISGGQNILIVGMMTAIFVLIASVILLITSIMFVSRFIILIFIMILSPVAFVMFIIPGMNSKFREWLNALINQSFFAPVFFALTWVVFRLGATKLLNTTDTQGVNWTAIVDAPGAAMGLVLNYFIIIGFSIFALVTSKKMASSVALFTTVSSTIGAATIGTAAILGRNTIGRRAKWLADNKRDEWEKTSGGRAKLWLANKTAERSFDIRALGGTAAGKAIGLDKALGDLGKAGGKGGFNKAIEDKAERKAKYAKQVYGQTAEETKKAKELEMPYLEAKVAEENRIKEERRKELEKAKREREEYIEKNINRSNLDKLENNRQEMIKELSRIEKSEGKNSPEYKRQYNEIENINNKIGREKDKLKEARINIEKNQEYIELNKKIEMAERKAKETEEKNWFDKVEKEEKSEQFIQKEKEYLKYKDAGTRRLKNYADRLRRKFGAGNQAAAKKIEDIIQGKDKKKPEQILKELEETLGIKKEKETPEEDTQKSDNKENKTK